MTADIATTSTKYTKILVCALGVEFLVIVVLAIVLASFDCQDDFGPLLSTLEGEPRTAVEHKHHNVGLILDNSHEGER